MKCEKEAMLLYAVTDRRWTGEQTLYEQVECSLKGGVTCLQLREKDLNDEDFLKEALEIKSVCNEYRVPFIINDNVEVAVKCDADGVHIGQCDMGVKKAREIVGDEMIIGVSAQTVEQALSAQADGADYIGVGTVFPTSTKLDADFVDYETLKNICNAVEIPVVAIGGINESNISELSGSGVDGIALVSAIFAADDIESECVKLRKLSEKMIKA